MLLISPFLELQSQTDAEEETTLKALDWGSSLTWEFSIGSSIKSHTSWAHHHHMAQNHRHPGPITITRPKITHILGPSPWMHNHASLTTARGEHDGPIAVSSGCRGIDASWTLHFELLLGLGICLRSSCFDPIGLAFSTSLHLAWHQLTHFS